MAELFSLQYNIGINFLTNLIGPMLFIKQDSIRKE